MLLKMLQHIFKRKYSTPSSSSLAHIITKPDSSNKAVGLPLSATEFPSYCRLIIMCHLRIHVYMMNKMGENGVDCSVVPLLPSGVNIILLFSYLL